MWRGFQILVQKLEKQYPYAGRIVIEPANSHNAQRYYLDLIQDGLTERVICLQKTRDLTEVVFKKSYAEIGEIVGLTEKNISVRIVRIKSKLKNLLS